MRLRLARAKEQRRKLQAARHLPRIEEAVGVNSLLCSLLSPFPFSLFFSEKLNRNREGEVWHGSHLSLLCTNHRFQYAIDRLALKRACTLPEHC